jgi:alkylation response protein AidB-like acyl-CoA dehydrogenase
MLEAGHSRPDDRHDPASSASGPGNTGLINLDDVAVPLDNRIGEEGGGFLIAMSAIDQVGSGRGWGGEVSPGLPRRERPLRP